MPSRGPWQSQVGAGVTRTSMVLTFARVAPLDPVAGVAVVTVAADPTTEVVVLVEVPIAPPTIQIVPAVVTLDVLQRRGPRQ